MRNRPSYKKWWRHSRCYSLAKFEKLFFSKGYLKLKKTRRVATVKYMQFLFCMQICSTEGHFDPPQVGIGLREQGLVEIQNVQKCLVINVSSPYEHCGVPVSTSCNTLYSATLVFLKQQFFLWPTSWYESFKYTNLLHPSVSLHSFLQSCTETVLRQPSPYIFGLSSSRFSIKQSRID